ncbi:MAG: LysR family transcriptional regulator [Pseudomonadota bacterium]
MRQLRRLRCFIAVAEHLHFRKAAEAMNLTQPALSQQIRELEAEIEATLFDRDRRSVTLTPAGERLLPAAREAVRVIDEAVADIDRLGTASDMLVRFGYLEYLNLPFLLPALAELRATKPQITTEVKHLNPSQVERALLDDEIDLGIGLLPVQNEDMAVRRILEGEWMLALHEDHPLAEMERIPIAEVGNEPLVLFARNVNEKLYDRLVDRFRADGVEPNIAYSVTQVSAGPGYAAQKLGAFFHASYVLSELPPSVIRRPVEGFPKLVLGLVWRGDRRTTAVRALLDCMKRVAGS